MKKNYFYLIVGILCVLFAFTHTLNGLGTALPVLDNINIDSGAKTTFTYIWHIIGIENLVFGIALIIMAFAKNKENVKFTAWVIIAVLIVRLIIISVFTLIDNESRISDVLIDSIAMVIVLVLLILGTRMKDKTE